MAEPVRATGTSRSGWRRLLRRGDSAPVSSAAAPPSSAAPELPLTLLHGATAAELTAVQLGHDLLVRADDLAAAAGWRVDGDTACDGQRRCDLPALRSTDGLVEPRAVAASLGVGTALQLDPDGAVLALGPRHDVPPLLPVGATAPEVDLIDREGRVVAGSELTGRRRVLIAVASWCGCREDLALWQGLADELAPDGPELVLIAVDDDPGRLAPWLDGVRLRVLGDPHREFCSAYGVVNVPTVIWVDEHDRVVRPARQVFADNRLREHHGIDCTEHHEALRTWAHHGVDPAPQPVAEDPVPPEQRSAARAELRLASWLLEHGRHAEAVVHLDLAGQLAPDDLTLRRAGLQLRGGDPFGEEFVELYRDWAELTGGVSYVP